MNSFLHQTKWDFRRVRLLWLLWILLLAGCSYVLVRTTLTAGRYSPLPNLLAALKYGAIYLGGALLTARLLFATPFSGTRSFWKTRPLSRSTLFWTKTVLLLSLFWIPAVAVQVWEWRALNMPSSFLLWGAVHFGALYLGVLGLAAFWASLARGPASFALGLAGTAGVLALSALVFFQLSERVSALPVVLGPAFPSSTLSASTWLVAVILAACTALAAWFCSGLFTRPPLAIVLLTAGVALIGGGGRLWKTNVLGFLEPASLPEVDLTAEVLAEDEAPEDDQQLLWSQVAVTLPSARAARPHLWNYEFQTGDTRRTASRSSSGYGGTALLEERLATLYPAGTTFLSPRAGIDSLIDGPFRNNAPASLTGTASLTLYEWRLEASLPLASTTAQPLDRGGLLGIGEVGRNEVELNRLAPPRSFDSVPDDPARHSSFHNEYSYVLYHDRSETAAVAERGSYYSRGAAAFSPNRNSVSIELSDATWTRLTGVENFADNRNKLRVDIYRAVPVAESEVRWSRNNWFPYFHRARPAIELPQDRPSPVARIPLPANPTPTQVDAYLDSILFSIPDNATRDEYQRIQDDLAAIGEEHADRLLARLPVGDYAENYIHKVLPKLLTEDHQESFLAALARDPGLVSVADTLGWQRPAAPVLARTLARRRPLDFPASPRAVAIVAGENLPATHADLRWHFLTSPYGLRDMAKALHSLPDFPFWETLAELWEEARYEQGSRPSEIAPFAARLGDKEALRIALVDYLERKNEEALQLLSQAVDHPSDDLLPGWIHDNFDALVFDEETRKFELP